jgi:flagellar motor switch protein FliG
MRYWDGRDLDVGGWREKPDLGASFSTLVFGFHDVARMRKEDLAPVLGWIEDAELAAALSGAPEELIERIYALLPLERIGKVRAAIGERETAATGPARELFVSVVRRL